MKLKKCGIFPSPSFDDVFRKINALRTLLPRKIKWSNSKQVEPEVAVSTGGSFMSPCCF